MGFLAWPCLFLCMTALPFLLGKGVLAVLYGRQERELHMADHLLTGWIAVIGLAEAAHLFAVLIGRSFSDAVFFFVTEIGLMALLAGGILLWRYHAGKKEAGGRHAGGRRQRRSERITKRLSVDGRAFGTYQVVLFLLFFLLVVYQLVKITASNDVYRTGDMTAETVESFLRTNAVYQVNPLTGRGYTEGIPFRLKILCLPTLYGAICRIFGIAVTEVVWKAIPVAVLVGSYLAYYLLASCFFPGSKNREERMLFMLLVAAVFCVGDYCYGMDGFGILYGGFRGVTIRNMVLLPYTFGLVLRRRFRSAALCILAEACIVWTLYGAGACLLVFAGFAAVMVYNGPNRPERTNGTGGAGEEAGA